MYIGLHSASEGEPWFRTGAALFCFSKIRIHAASYFPKSKPPLRLTGMARACDALPAQRLLGITPTQDAHMAPWIKLSSSYQNGSRVVQRRHRWAPAWIVMYPRNAAFAPNWRLVQNLLERALLRSRSLQNVPGRGEKKFQPPLSDPALLPANSNMYKRGSVRKSIDGPGSGGVS